eukprot:scaffold68151_cov55-Phaeocystis_antarctica.AAC.2
MFPTHFASIATLYAALTGRKAVPVRAVELTRPGQVRAVELMARHADLEATTAADGYNPLLEDFKNTSVLVTDWEDKEPR